MQCLFCGYGRMNPDTTNVNLSRGEQTVVINNVPATICARCHEYYLNEEVAGQVLAMAEKAVCNIAKAESATISYSF